MSLLYHVLRPKTTALVPKVAASSNANKASRAASRWQHNTRQAQHCYDTSGRCERGQCGHSKVAAVEDIFIRALVQASSCGTCASSPSARARPTKRSTTHNQQRRHHSTSTVAKRNFSSQHSNNQTLTAPAFNLDADQGSYVPREQYRSLAETYDSPSELWDKPRSPASIAPTPPALPAFPPSYAPLAPRLVLTPEQENRPPHVRRQILPPEDEEHAARVKQLKRYLKHHKSTVYPTKAWRLYLSLGHNPRPRYLTDATLRLLFLTLARVEFKDTASSKRYFSLLDECLQEGVPVGVEAWNTAISFAGRWVKYTTTAEMKSAAETWMRMENEGVRADHVTFNILFDIAIRAGRFALADTIFQELKARDMPLNRYFRTSMIYYAGLRRNGNGVRSAFKDLVNSGEIVDTSVMNCVVISLIRSGEAAAAENVFVKMKDLHATKFGAAPARSWQERREQGRRLNKIARELKLEKQEHEASFFGSTFSSEEKKEAAQRLAPIHPDNRTCQILIRYHALRSGNLARIYELLRELKEGGWHIHGSVYNDIFRGFWLRGGHAYTPWNREALEGFWSEFLSSVGPAPLRPEETELAEAQRLALEKERVRTPFFPGDDSAIFDEGDEDDESEESSNEERKPYFTTILAKAVINAFYRCAGAPRMLEVWEQMLERWEGMSEDDRVVVGDVVEKLRGEGNMYAR